MHQERTCTPIINQSTTHQTTSSSSSSFSPARYVPPGPSSLSSDAPGYYYDDDHNCVGDGRSEPAGDDGKGAGAADALPGRVKGTSAKGDEGGAGRSDDDDARAESKNERTKQAADDGSPPTSSSLSTRTTMLGPACWKCKGTGVVAPKKKKKKRAKKKAKKKKRRLATTTSNNDHAEEEEIKAAKPDSSDNDAPSCEEGTDSGGADGGVNDDSNNKCPVCRGAGRLPVRSKWRTSQEHMPGCVTSRRKRPVGWTPGGPVPPALAAALAWNDAATRNQRRWEEEEGDGAGGEKEGADVATEHYALRCLLDAEGVDNCNDEGGDDAGRPPRDVPILLPTTNNPSNTPGTPTARPIITPKWLPVHRGEQLCNLVGRWRIVQRVGSHRWTTDDLVTAYVAGRFVVAGGAARGGGITSSSQTSLPKAATATTAMPMTTTTTTLKYLDLGTGNGSVLQMVSWYALKAWGVHGSATAAAAPSVAIHPLRQRCDDGKMTPRLLHRRLDAVGVEARNEAVQLARRSLAFNVGDDGNDEMVEDQGESGHRRFYDVDGDRRSGGDGTNDDGVDSCRRTVEANIDVVRGDFRDLVDLSKRVEAEAKAHNASSSSGAAHNGAEEDGPPSRERRRLERVARRTYDLITGTPPYFRVDFGIASSSETAGDADGGVVKSAVIRQGGMPTSIQSAPARCEFRGGIEAYCRTASALLRPPQDCDDGDDDGGVFVVCENWLNDQRAYDGAAAAGLEVVEVFPVKGREGRKENLFAVYVMRLRRRTTKGGGKGRDALVDGSDTHGDGGRGTAVVHPPLVVRDAGGRWTAAYADVLEDMSIPARHTVAPPTTK